jgi:hypothetical protein
MHVLRGRLVVPQRVTSGKSELRAAQRRALQALASEPGAALTRADYAVLTGVSPSEAAADLSELVSAGLLVRVGRGRAGRYELAPEAGRSDGGAGAPRVPHRRRLVWAALVGVAALAAFGAAARNLPLVATHGFSLTTVFGTTTKAASGPSVKPRSVHRSAAEPVRPPHAAPQLVVPPTKVAAKHAAGRAKSERPASSAPHVQQQVAQQPTYVSHVVTAAPVQTAPTHTHTQTSAAATPQASGPAPMPAPAGSSPPQPLRAP